MTTKKTETPAQTLAAITKRLNLKKGATASEINEALAAREQEIVASIKAKKRPPAFTPKMVKDGEMLFSSSQVRLAADEIEPLMRALTSDAFKEFLVDHKDELATRKDIIAAREARRAK